MNPQVRDTTGSIPALDGIRALAVALVFFAHGGLDGLIPGGLGVTVFFVLSGYLITTLMRIEHGRCGSLSFRAFYLRRVLRLMPPLFIVVGLTWLLAALDVIEGDFTLSGLLSVLFYFGNYHIIATDFGGIPSGVGVVWSLAVEEHYYLLYPPLALLLLRLRRPRRAVAVLLALCVAVLLWRLWLHGQGVPEHWPTMASDTRVDAILAGCVLALWHNPWLDPLPRQRRGLEALVAVACIALLLATLLYRDEAFRLTLRYSLQSLAIAPLLWLAVARAQQRPYRWLNLRPMVWLGTVSYSVYLSHQIITLGIEYQLPQLGIVPTMILAVLLTGLFAELMRRAVEQPCARLRQRLHREWFRRPAPPAPAAPATPDPSAKREAFASAAPAK